MLLREL
jgi:hypothetical protein